MKNGWNSKRIPVLYTKNSAPKRKLDSVAGRDEGVSFGGEKNQCAELTAQIYSNLNGLYMDRVSTLHKYAVRMVKNIEVE